MPDGGDDAEQLDRFVAVGAERFEQRIDFGSENLVVRPWRNREYVIGVTDTERAFLVLEPQFLSLQRRAVRITKNRQQHLVRQLWLQWMPVDVEDVGIAGAGAV